MVVDGSYCLQSRRYPLYESIARHSIDDVIFLRSVCLDRDIVRARIEERRKKKMLPENEAAKMENYLTTLEEDESLFEDELLQGGKPSIVEFNTGPDYSVYIRQGDSDLARLIRELVWRDFHTGRLNSH